MSIVRVPFSLTGGAAWGYTVNNSALFDGSTGYLSRTPGSASNRNTLTLSMWVKKWGFSPSINDVFFGAGTSSGSWDLLYFNNNNTMALANGGVSPFITSRAFRTTSWNHYCFAWDTTDGTAADRIKLYINGVRDTNFSSTSNYSASENLEINNNVAHYISYLHGTAGRETPFYLAECVLIDGQALDPTSFGESDIYGNWNPIDCSGLTFGTNGFYLKFENGAALGEDSSGNGNNWTVNGTITQSNDVPTDFQNGSQGDALTFSSIYYSAPNAPTNGNKTATGDTGSANNEGALGTLYFDVTENWWVEFVVNAVGSLSFLGLADTSVVPTAGTDNQVNGTGAGSVALYRSDTGNFINGSGVSGSAYGATYTTSDVIGVHISGGAVTFYKQTGGTGSFVSQGVAVSGLSGYWTINACGYGTPSWTLRVLESDWGNGSPPTGAKSINTANLTKSEDIRSEHFNTVLYNGNGTVIGSGGNAVSGVGFSPNFVWIKNRTPGAYSHGIFDTLRGATKYVHPNLTSQEYTDAESLATFDADGFTVGNGNFVNNASNTFVAWCAKLPNSETNSSGTISVDWIYNATLGMAVGNYTGTGSVGTLGLPTINGTAPFMAITKRLDGTSTWVVYNEGVASNPETYYMIFNTTAAKVDASISWNDTAPTSSVFTIGTDTSLNTLNGIYNIIVFWETNLCKKVKYEGNSNADGPVWYANGKPVWMLQKDADAVTNWHITDSVRDTANVIDKGLYVNLSNAEFTFTMHDFLSTGVKLRTSSAGFNVNTNIGVAFVNPPPAGPGQLRSA